MAVQAIDTNSCLEDTQAGTLDELEPLIHKGTDCQTAPFSFQQHGEIILSFQQRQARWPQTAGASY